MPYKPKITTRGISTSTVSTDSIPKNAALTNNELDSNFLNIRDASIGVASDDSTVIDIGLGNTLRVVGSSGISTAVSGQTLTISSTGGGSTDLVNDISPQLGGNLDINNFNIVSDSENIKIIPGPTGRIQLDNGIWPQAPGPTGAYLKTDGAGYSSGFSDGSTPDSLSWSYPTGWLDFDRQQSPAETNITSSYDTYWKLSGSTTLSIVDATSENGISFVDTSAIVGGADTGYQGGITGPRLALASTSADLVLYSSGLIDIKNQTTVTTIGANGAASALTANPVGYLKIKINGTTYQLPYYNI